MTVRLSDRRPAPCVTHLILVDFGNLGIAFTETVAGLTFQGAIDLLADFDKVMNVFCADEEAGTFRDVTSDVADYLSKQAWDELCPSERDLCERFGLVPDEGEDEPLDGYAHQRREATLMGHFV